MPPEDPDQEPALDQPPGQSIDPIALTLALELVTRQRLRLADAGDVRLGGLAGHYELGLASWTGSVAGFVGFYHPPGDPGLAGQDLAERCFAAQQWGQRRLGEQDASHCYIVLVALGPVSGELNAQGAQDGNVQIGVVSLDPGSGEARNLLPSPRGLIGAREVAGAARSVKAGHPVPTLAAVDLAERQTVTGGYAQPAAQALRQVPIVTYSLIGLWVALWIVETLSRYSGISQGQAFTGYHLVDGMVFIPDQLDWWRFLSSAFIHAPDNPLHVGFNCFFMWNIGRFVELMYGRLVLLGTFVFSALIGSIFVWLGNDLGLTSVSSALGASGGLCGFLTLMYVVGIVQGKNVPVGVKDMLRRNGGINTVFILVYSFALAGSIAVGAHVGGFVGGALAGLVLPPLAGIGGRPLRAWEKAVIFALIAFAAVSLAFGLYEATIPGL